MDNIIKTSLKVSVSLPTKDGKKWSDENAFITVTQYFDTDHNLMSYSMRIPSYIFNMIKDTDEKYITNHPKPEHSWESKKKNFTQNLKSEINLMMLLNNFSDICFDCIETTKRQEAQSEKYIAIRFNHGHQQCKDDFNFASMGMKTTSSFQFFTLFKTIHSKDSLDRYIYKTDVQIGGQPKPDGWSWFGVGSVDNWKMVKWTQEREDFFIQVQAKFVSINNELDSFLGDLDDDKLIALMNNSQFLLK